MEANWKKMTAERAGELLKAEQLQAEGQAVFDPGMRPDECIKALAEVNQWGDAVGMAARTLPPREAVWWACVCSHKMTSMADDAAEQAALTAAEKWVFQPGDERRKEAFRLAQECEGSLAGSLCAMAVTFNESKLPLADGSETELDPGIFPSMVVGAVSMSAGDAPVEQIIDRFKLFLDSAENIANGGDGRIAELE